MSDKKSKDSLSSFKIGDSHQPGMSAPAEQTKQSEGPESHTLGFMRIEQLLESADPVAVGQGLAKVLKDLEGFRDAASSNKDKAAAKKAIAAMERAVDLIDYLFQTKNALEANTE